MKAYVGKTAWDGFENGTLKEIRISSVDGSKVKVNRRVVNIEVI